MSLDHLKNEALGMAVIDWAVKCNWALTRAGQDRYGPCPKCGGDDRFSINIRKNAWHCRKCEKGGHDVISLVMHVEEVDFKTALERITGHKAADPVDPIVAQRRAKELADKKRRQEAFAERERQKAIHDAKKLIALGAPPHAGGAVEAYLRQRGLGQIASSIAAGRFKLRLGEIAAFVRRHEVKKDGQTKWETVWTGPAMVAAIQQADGSATGVHLTFLDRTKPKGKAHTIDPNNGKPLPAKIVRGSAKTGAIRLFTPSAPTRLVMGEGIETTLTALQAAFAPHTAYWAGVSLSIMAGGVGQDEGGTRRHDLPDLDAPAFVPPPWCTEFIILRDGDSDSAATEKKLLRCARRAMALRPGLKARIADAVPGKDFNDMLVEGA